MKIWGLNDVMPSRNLPAITANMDQNSYGTHFCYIRLQSLNQTHFTDGKLCLNGGAFLGGNYLPLEIEKL